MDFFKKRCTYNKDATKNADLRRRSQTLTNELLLEATPCKSLVKAIDTTAGINNFLLTRKERMTPTTNVNSDILRKR